MFSYVLRNGDKVTFLLRVQNYYELIYTPNGTDVAVPLAGESSLCYVGKYVDDIPDVVKADIIECYSEKYTGIELVSPPTTNYNCHSYAWYSRNVATNDIWIDNPGAYYHASDMSYERVYSPRVGDIICYYDTAVGVDNPNVHSGVIIGFSNESPNGVCGNANTFIVQSKWSFGGLYTHKGDECPYTSKYGGDADEVRFYRPRTNHAFSLSPSMSGISIARSINASGLITSQYGMYELNVTTSGKYTITIESNHGLDNKLFDANMNRRYMTVAESTANRYTYVVTLTPGRYYLRTAYADASNSGTIQIRIEPHSHIYNDWTYKDHSSHIESCCCGAQGTATASHVIRQSSIVNNRATCLDCGYLLDLRNDSYIIESPDGLRYTENGSYILPNGIVVLVDEDVDAYFAGTLIFRNRNEHIGE